MMLTAVLTQKLHATTRLEKNQLEEGTYIMLCPFCRYLCQEALQQTEKLDQSNVPLDEQHNIIEHIPAHNAEELLYGVQNDCYMCLRFWTLASQEYRDGVERGMLYPPENQYKTVSSFHIYILLDEDTVRNPQEHRRITIWLYHSNVDYRSCRPSFQPSYSKEGQEFTILLASDLDPLLPSRYDEYQIGNNYDAASISTQLQTWMKCCFQDHPKCPKPRSLRADFPTRLLQVGDIVKLVDTTEIDKSEAYITLSYTWGSPSTVIKTTDSTISTHRAGIPLSSMPETLRDVINITRSIGVKYIWIDSLCIIQDQPDFSDFSVEAQHIGEIYTNSLLTLAASRGRGTHVTCFANRISNSLIIPERFIPEPLPNNFNSIKPSHYRSGHFYVIDRRIWESAVTKAALNSRGWVLQERLLSPRTVHLCQDQAFWECGELAACEALPIGLPYKAMDRRGGKTTAAQNQLKNFINDCRIRVPQGIIANFLSWSPWQQRSSLDHRNHALDRWNQIVGVYTKCNLTDPTDKIVAIAGVAQRLKPVINDTFIAGLWKTFLVYGLAWEAGDGSMRSRRCSRRVNQEGKLIYCGPTWSWVSVEGSVNYSLGSDFDQWESRVTVENCIVQPANQEFAKAVEIGTVLRLRGRLRRLKLIRKKKLGGREQPSHYVSVRLGREHVKPTTIKLDATEMEDHLDKELFVVPILWRGAVRRRDVESLMGLVLEKWEDSYKRVGFLLATSFSDEDVLTALTRGKRLPVVIKIV